MEAQPSLTETCSEFGCETAIHYLNINKADSRVFGGFCLTHGQEILANPLPGFRLEEIPDPEHPDMPHMPLKTVPKEDPPMAIASTPTPAAQMAPPDAVYDYEIGEDAVEPSRHPTTEEASTNFFWKYGKNVTFDLQTTVRGCPTVEEMAAHVDVAIKTMKMILDKGGLPKYSSTPAQTGAVPAETPAAGTPAPTAGNGTPPPAGGTPAGGETATGGTFVASRMTVTPRTDGKIDVGFFQGDDKYPLTRIIGNLQQVLARLDHCGNAWTQAHFEKVGAYNVKYKVTFVLSEKMNKAGNPYKNITDVSPA